MDDRRVGRLIRRARAGRRWRQLDLERASGVDQTAISLIERARIEGLTVRTIRRVIEAVQIRLELWPRLPASEVSRLLDEGHAAIVEQVIVVLRQMGWETTAEYTFSHFGERGSVDGVGWHSTTKTLLIVEVKTPLLDVQDLIATLDRKCRLFPQLLMKERGWRPDAVGRIVAVEEASAARRVVASHQATFDSTFPARARRTTQWVARPVGPISALWFLSPTYAARGTRRVGAIQRVRVAG